MLEVIFLNANFHKVALIADKDITILTLLGLYNDDGRTEDINPTIQEHILSPSKFMEFFEGGSFLELLRR